MRQASTSKGWPFSLGCAPPRARSPHYRNEVHVSGPFPRIQMQLRRQSTVGSMSATAIFQQPILPFRACGSTVSTTQCLAEL